MKKYKKRMPIISVDPGKGKDMTGAFVLDRFGKIQSTAKLEMGWLEQRLQEGLVDSKKWLEYMKNNPIDTGRMKEDWTDHRYEEKQWLPFEKNFPLLVLPRTERIFDINAMFTSTRILEHMYEGTYLEKVPRTGFFNGEDLVFNFTADFADTYTPVPDYEAMLVVGKQIYKGVFTVEECVKDLLKNTANVKACLEIKSQVKMSTHEWFQFQVKLAVLKVKKK